MPLETTCMQLRVELMLCLHAPMRCNAWHSHAVNVRAIIDKVSICVVLRLFVVDSWETERCRCSAIRTTGMFIGQCKARCKGNLALLLRGGSMQGGVQHCTTGAAWNASVVHMLFTQCCRMCYFPRLRRETSHATARACHHRAQHVGLMRVRLMFTRSMQAVAHDATFFNDLPQDRLEYI